jgi:hypothetical protein
MNAHDHGYGFVVPTPGFSSSQLGTVVYIDEGGVIREIGNIFDDGHFKTLVNRSDSPLNRTTTAEEYLSVAAAFTTGSMDVRALTEEELSTYVYFPGRLKNRSVLLDDENVPETSRSAATCGWLFTRKNPGPGHAMILGPMLRKVRLNVQEKLVAQWIKDAPRKATFWTTRSRRLLPKLLVVLEEWTCPSWTRISWKDESLDPGPTAVGLLMSGATNAPAWMYLALSNKTTTSFSLGNTSVLRSLIMY